MNISFIPMKIKENKYCELMVEAIKLTDYRFLEFNKKNFFKIDVLHLNWYENISGPNNFILYFRFIKKILFIFICKTLNIKIIWTMHNKVPHDTKNNIPKIMIKFLLKQCDIIIIHSKQTLDIIKNNYVQNIDEEKVIYLPHPNYINVYESNLIKNQKDSKLKFLFIGQIRPYKNIEKIISIANKLDNEIIFKIRGLCTDEIYKKKLKGLINKNNVEINFEFIEDNEIVALIDQADIILLPYDIKSSLNSGTVILAFSNKKTVVAPYIPMLNDFDSDLYYGYQYNNDKEHELNLEFVIKRVISDYNQSNEILANKGRELYNIVKQKHSKEEIAKILKRIYLNLGMEKRK